jgi:hypothetical protein
VEPPQSNELITSENSTADKLDAQATNTLDRDDQQEEYSEDQDEYVDEQEERDQDSVQNPEEEKTNHISEVLKIEGREEQATDDKESDANSQQLNEETDNADANFTPSPSLISSKQVLVDEHFPSASDGFRTRDHNHTEQLDESEYGEILPSEDHLHETTLIDVQDSPETSYPPKSEGVGLHLVSTVHTPVSGSLEENGGWIISFTTSNL